MHGREVVTTSLAELAGEIGLVFANPFNQITGARFTVREEMAFGLENLGVPRDEMPARIDRVLELPACKGWPTDRPTHSQAASSSAWPWPPSS